MFDLNLMTPVDTTNATRLAEQVALLKQAQGMGLPVRYVELGNEFYLSTADYDALPGRDVIRRDCGLFLSASTALFRE